ncbi:hypothetical protein [Helicobacter zhangjianzhongii]|uniref:Uncharacterized protein n=1 Tax=Helicobacter zhangjianzhongii TaxID=2974574 RepID=A0ACC6FSM4_9HELI|nr:MULTISPECIES: hypothetical protein [unclassified Helicobacter]MDL0079408.1 hypothetical protein [Helicobacter sp. CPD2-1]MDL0081691.1 hypothetical protein [Helicobacter sp. XJK30-2]
MRLITRFLRQPQTISLALPQKSCKTNTAPPQFLESFLHKNAFFPSSRADLSAWRS